MAMATDVVRQPVVKLLLSSGKRLGGSSGHRDGPIQSIHMYLFHGDLARASRIGSLSADPVHLGRRSLSPWVNTPATLLILSLQHPIKTLGAHR